MLNIRVEDMPGLLAIYLDGEEDHPSEVDGMHVIGGIVVVRGAVRNVSVLGGFESSGNYGSCLEVTGTDWVSNATVVGCQLDAAIDLVDVDGDGHDADISPDEDCDGADPVDTDGDGWPDDQDCAPDDASIHFGADEECNGVDDNCDGDIDEHACEELVDGTATETEAAGTCGAPGCRATPAAALFLPLFGLVRRRRTRPRGRVGSVVRQTDSSDG